MTAHPLPAPAAPTHASPAPPSQRHDGWTPDRQRSFVEGIAGGDTVEQACRRVGLAVSSAYALRRRANGAAFALAWDGARLLAREALADTLLTRALEGQEETITRADGSTVTRYRHDNRLATHMLHRLDRFADAASASAHGTAARLVASEFDAFLDLLGTHAAPARAGLFLGTRLAADTLGATLGDPLDDAAPLPAARGAAALADLAPVLALARADRYLRTRAAHAAEVSVADLDPADRAAWTAEQWTRAEAAGLVALAPPPLPTESAFEPPLPPLRPAHASDPLDPADRPDPVWWCEHADAWRTRFPPPPDFIGEEDGAWGDADYSRSLDEDEVEQLERPHRIQAAVRHVVEARERDRWFADAARMDDDVEDDPAIEADEEPCEDAPGHDRADPPGPPDTHAPAADPPREHRPAVRFADPAPPPAYPPCGVTPPAECRRPDPRPAPDLACTPTPPLARGDGTPSAPDS